MKKLFIFVIALGLFWGGKAYSACTWQGDDTATATCVKNANDNTSKCTWGGDLTTCTTFDPTAFAGSQTACDTSKQAQAVARIKLCGSLANYDTSKNRCADSTPKGRGGGIWGYFQQTCFSDNFGGVVYIHRAPIIILFTAQLLSKIDAVLMMCGVAALIFLR